MNVEPRKARSQTRAAENLRTATELMAEDARDDVPLLAVTLDPARDTEQALQDFTTVHRLANTPNWFALRGDSETLARGW